MPDRVECLLEVIKDCTDWFVPFSSVRILARKVASAEPHYCWRPSGRSSCPAGSPLGQPSLRGAWRDHRFPEPFS